MILTMWLKMAMKIFFWFFSSKSLVVRIKVCYLCVPLRRETKQSVSKKCREREKKIIDTTGRKDKEKAILKCFKQIRTFEITSSGNKLWRVWSWLRMNASGRLNTCKSNGNSRACFGWRVAHGWVTRTQPTYKRWIPSGNGD